MSVSRFWREHAADLKPYRANFDIGLHLTLTALPPLTQLPRLAPHGRLPSIGELTKSAYLKQLDAGEIEQELSAQFDRFAEFWGAAPGFIDGHQHAHILPGIRDAVVKLHRERAPSAYIRQCYEPPLWVLRRNVSVKRALIISTLARGTRQPFAHIRSNDSFRGVTDFDQHQRYPEHFKRYLLGSGNAPLIMCHPGHVDDELAEFDPVLEPREHELNYFLSEEFAADLGNHGFVLGKFAG